MQTRGTGDLWFHGDVRGTWREIRERDWKGAGGNFGDNGWGLFLGMVMVS